MVLGSIQNSGAPFFPPMGMVGELSMANRRYIGDRESELRCGRAPCISTVKCIFAPIERCDAAPNEDGNKDIERRLKLTRRSLAEGFEAPKFAAQGESRAAQRSMVEK